MISLNLCLLALCLACFRSLRYGWLLSIAIVIGCNVKILGYSACEYYAAFFATPSVLSVALSACYVARILCQALLERESSALESKRPRLCQACLQAKILPFSAQVLMCGLGLWLYLGALGIGLVDIYYIDSRAQAAIIVGVLCLSAWGSRSFALLGVLSLIGGALLGLGLYESVIDVGLWLLCSCLVLKSAYQNLRAKLRSATMPSSTISNTKDKND